MAKEYQVNEKIIRKIVKKDLHMSTFAIQKRQALIRLQKEKRKFRITKLLDEITTQSLEKNAFNGKPNITECYMVIFVEQPDKTLLDWCENKWVNNLNAKININRIFLSYNCD